VRGAARGGRQRDADHADGDREHRGVLVAPGVLAEHALAEKQENQQTAGKRGLHDDQRGQPKRHHLEREAQHREPGAEQPARARDEPAREREAQVRLPGRLLGVHRLQGDP
jgi:hypothetical protein